MKNPNEPSVFDAFGAGCENQVASESSSAFPSFSESASFGGGSSEWTHDSSWGSGGTDSGSSSSFDW